MDSQTVDRPSTVPKRALAALGVVAAVVVIYLALSAILEATTSIDFPLTNWPF
jgi:hypothetical protein